MASGILGKSMLRSFFLRANTIQRALKCSPCLIKQTHCIGLQRLNFSKSVSYSQNGFSPLCNWNRLVSMRPVQENSSGYYNPLLKGNLRVHSIFNTSGFNIVACYNSSFYPILNKDVISRYYSKNNSRNSSSKNNTGINGSKRLINRSAVLKRHEYIRSVLREKQKRIRQTKQQLQRSGKMILADIKESKTKMRERMEEIIERENIWTIPNMLCVTRIGMSPYLGYLIVQHEYKLALCLVIFAGITDMLDGVIARSFKTQSTKLGSFLDPMADKVLIATLFLTLTYSGNIPVPLTALIVARDMLLVGAGIYIRYKSLPPPKTLSRYLDVSHATAELAPTTISKINTTVQLCTVFTTLAAVSFDFQDHPTLIGLWYLTAGTTVASLVSYMVSKDTYKILKRKSK